VWYSQAGRSLCTFVALISAKVENWFPFGSPRLTGQSTVPVNTGHSPVAALRCPVIVCAEPVRATQRHALTTAEAAGIILQSNRLETVMALLLDQKISLSPTCIFRPGLALVNCPNVGVPNVAPGKPKFGWLKILKNSQRNCRSKGWSRISKSVAC